MKTLLGWQWIWTCGSIFGIVVDEMVRCIKHINFFSVNKSVHNIVACKTVSLQFCSPRLRATKSGRRPQTQNLYLWLSFAFCGPQSWGAKLQWICTGSSASSSCYRNSSNRSFEPSTALNAPMKNSAAQMNISYSWQLTSIWSTNNKASHIPFQSPKAVVFTSR